ncbi:recombinase RecA [Neisseria arctica]|uniref:Recombinase RecA n=1 Tax=Neisseria arctica TaxID=1470200 RepID=A0A0J0YQW2_9NEIS|nr:recombinase RecA [Neisseria arctica]KLT72521.1 recombinase RecA [Neisseria arctica]UOO87574.1 recombinase RecA [Neisseria arctica]
MPFTLEKQRDLLAQKGIGPTILQRLQQMGLDNIEALANADIEHVLEQGSQITGSSCWRNSPQAHKAIKTAIDWAKQQLRHENNNNQTV